MKLYTNCLESLIFLFIALDHQNYSSWLSVHIRDLNTMTDKQFKELSANSTIKKKKKKIFQFTYYQIHEQENCKVNGKGGIIGLTENRSTLQKWMICSPEILRIVTKFEVFHIRSKTNNYSHHNLGSSYQGKFHKVLHLMQTMEEYGNLFSCYSEELYALDTGYYADKEVLKTLYSIETLGHDQYLKFYENVFTNGSRSIQTPIKRNLLKIFKTNTKKISKTSQQIQCE